MKAEVTVFDGEKIVRSEEQKLEAFLCVADGTTHPEYTKQVTAYWLRQHQKKEKENGVELTVLLPAKMTEEVGKIVGEMLEGSGVKIARVGYQEERAPSWDRDKRVWAQIMAKSDSQWYIVTEDDWMPTSETFYKTAKDIISRHPRAKEFGVVACWPENAKIYPWRPFRDEMVRGEVYSDSEIMEHVSVGGIRIVQKAAHEMEPGEWEEKRDNGSEYNREHADMLRKRGYRSGWLRGIKATHLGEQERIDDSGHPEHPSEPDFQV